MLTNRPIIVIWIVAHVLVASLVAIAQEAVGLNNGNIEDGIGEEPAHWLSYLEPNSKGKLYWDKTQHHSGLGSLAISVTSVERPKDDARPYYHSWSQNLFGIEAGTQLTLSGYVKTDKAEGAALWLQCWDDKASQLATTQSGNYLSGSQDWTQLTASLAVPKNTATVTVRCVLLNTGAAWFDDLELKTTDSKSKKEKKEENDNHSSSELLKRSHESLIEANKSLVETNKSLVDQLKSLRETIETTKQEHAEQVYSLKQQIEELERAVKASAVPFSLPRKGGDSTGESD